MRGLEPTLSDLQTQIDQLTEIVRKEREAPGSPQAAEQLRELTEKCREILGRWSEIDDRHTQAISDIETRLHEWSAIEDRLSRDGADRMRALEHAIEREWKTLRDVHQAPVRELREQATALGETSVAAANLSLRAFERAEARFAALEADLHARLGQLAEEVHGAIADVRRGGVRPALPTPMEPFALDSVMRIHEEHRGANPADALRAAASRAVAAREDVVSVPPPAQRLALPEAAALNERIASLERAVTSEREDARHAAAQTEKLEKFGKRSTMTAVIGGIALLAATAVGLLVERQISVRLDEAASRATAAERQAQVTSDAATRDIAAAKADAAKQLASAREVAARAELASTVLAAADVVRFNLEGSVDAGHATGHALFSRSTGLVVNANHLPPVPDGSVCQIWLIGASGPVSAGSFSPDERGHAMFATDAPPDVPRPVSSVMVTIELAGGRPASPSGTIVLTRVAQQ
jgi:hypothetical protein